uniref:Putative mif4g-like type 3 domain-containing protein eukaryotic translation initiation factor n=1 Tax=Amblyomma triste TaxID=251400 RepID=A0A023G7Q0_AMBTT
MKEQDKQPEAKEDDLSKMSLADKLKMFNQKVTLDVLQQKPPVRSNSMRRSLGPQTGGAEPATPVMGTTASLGVPLARTRSHSSPPEDSAQPTSAAAPKGILKVQAGPQPVVKSILKQEHPEVKEDVKGILKPEQPADNAPTTPVKPILKPEKSSPEVESPKSTSSESSSEEEEEEEDEEEEKGWMKRKSQVLSQALIRPVKKTLTLRTRKRSSWVVSDIW